MRPRVPVTILFISATPINEGVLATDEEHRAIVDAKARTEPHRGAFDVHAAPAVRFDDLGHRVREHQPAVVHFGGHAAEAGRERGQGDTRGSAGAAPSPGPVRGELLFLDEHGWGAPVPIEALTDLFRLEGVSVRCAVLNACNTEAQAEALARHVDCAIGTTRAVEEVGALAFARGFYGKLCAGGSVLDAFDAGRNAVAAARVPASYALVCREGVDARQVRLVERMEAPFHVPFARNPQFVGREEDLRRLHAMIQERGAAGIRPVAAVGMGGIGKTQLAVEYAHRYAAHYRGGVYWINAAGNDWRPVVATLAVKLGVDAREGPEGERQMRLIAGLEGHLRARPEALVVFDNVESPAELETDARAGFVPSNLGCRVLFTARRRDVGPRFGSIEVSVLPAEAGLTLLLSTRPEAWAVEAEVTAGRAIVQAFGGLPLAIVLAAAFLGKNKFVTLAGYAQRVGKYGALKATDTNRVPDEELSTRHKAAVEATLASQWEALESKDARLVLQAAALLGEAAEIRRARLSLLTGLAARAEEGFAAPLEEALGELVGWSLVEDLEERKAIRLHPLVRESAERQIGGREEFAAACAERLGEALWEMGRLHEELAGRGVDEVLGDLRVGMRLAGAERRARLERLARPLDREAHCLRRWDAEREPEFLLQQLRNRCFEMGFGEVQERAEKELAERKWSWLCERIPTSRESEALVRTLEGHTNFVTSVAVTSDGHLAVSASEDKMLRVWDLATGHAVRSLVGHTDFVTSVATLPDGRFAVSASRDKTLKVWDLATGHAVRSLVGHSDGVRIVAIAPDGRLAISASWDKTLKVWDLATGQALRTIHDVNGGAMTSNGRFAVSVSMDNTLKVWDLVAGEAVRSLEGHTGQVTGLAMTSDGRLAISASADKTLKVWDLATGHLVRSLEGHSDGVGSVAVTSDGRFAVSASWDKTLKVWDLAMNRSVRTLYGHSGGVGSVALTSDGRFVVSASWDKTLKVWDLGVGKATRLPSGHAASTNGVAMTPDGRIAVSASADQTLKVWDLGEGRSIRTLSGHTGSVNGVAMTPDSRFVVSASADGTLRAWDLTMGRAIRTFSGHIDRVNGVAMTSNGRFAISASEDDTIKVWHLATGQTIRCLRHPRIAPRRGRLILVPEFSQRDHAFKRDVYRVTSVAMTAGGRIVISASDDRTLRVWDLATGRSVHTLEGHSSGVTSVALMSDGRFAVSASSDKTLRVWDLATGRSVHILEGHSSGVTSVALMSDGRFAVSASSDKTLKVWNLATSRSVATLETHAPLLCCAISSDARTIVAGDELGALHILDWINPINPP